MRSFLELLWRKSARSFLLFPPGSWLENSIYLQIAAKLLYMFIIEKQRRDVMAPCYLTPDIFDGKPASFRLLVDRECTRSVVIRDRYEMRSIRSI
jgi:hypothetical protein